MNGKLGLLAAILVVQVLLVGLTQLGGSTPTAGQLLNVDAEQPLDVRRIDISYQDSEVSLQLLEDRSRWQVADLHASEEQVTQLLSVNV